MNRDSFQLPSARTWRDIPQPAVPRAMSREGRWRLVMAGLRTTAVVAVLGACAWGTWLVAVTLRENTAAMPAAAKATPMKKPELRTDGVLDQAWLVRTLALPRHASLMELDLQALRTRLLSDDQVVNATLTRSFPDRLIVQVSERSPVARVMTECAGAQRQLLVARDGVVYTGNGYDPALLDTLPWLDGVTITPEGAHFRPLRDMEPAADLLAKARLEAEHLYNAWNVVSLKKVESDSRIEVRAKNDAYVVYFNTRDDYFRQLVKLNYICDQLAAVPEGSKVTIDLTLLASGTSGPYDVPVMVAPPPPEVPAGSAAPADSRPMYADRAAAAPALPRFGDPKRTDSHSEPALFVLPPAQSKKVKREL